MDEKQLYDEFLSIINESHPGLTFEEYRDCCIFLLFYQYLCLKYDKELEDQYKLGEMVRLAVRGKLQMPSFLRFMENASGFLHLNCPQFNLMEASFLKKVSEIKLSEKKKSYARFIRKLIKKVDRFECDELLLKDYPDLFRKLIIEFSRMKKSTYISETVLKLFEMFFQDSGREERKIFLPEFQYGILLESVSKKCKKPEIYGYDNNIEYIELLRIYAYMTGLTEDQVHLFREEEWEKADDLENQFDVIAVYQPEGVEDGILLSSAEPLKEKDLLTSKSKGEFPYLLSALPLLKEDGALVAVLPSALLYREGKEQQIRKILVDELGCLDTVMLLPDSLFQSVGQDEVLMYLKKGRNRSETMFFDCAKYDFEEDGFPKIEKAWRDGETIPGLCSKVEVETIRENDYNLNLPRYIMQTKKSITVDVAAKRRRIQEIDQELQEIEGKISMYRRDLGGL
ncbi:MAG: N-6 DNA methylase [Lachnospiraceae bacterium]|nr:N-6 DNA methylase [Lachnospiraceae bacterium]